MMFHKKQEHETAKGFHAGKYMAQYFSVLNLIHYTTLHYTTLHYMSPDTLERLVMGHGGEKVRGREGELERKF